MIQFRALLVATALLVAGCSSSGGGDSPSSSAPASASSKQAQAVADLMRKGMSGLTSAHLAVNAGALGGRSVADVQYADGHATASDITVDVGGGKARIVTVGDKSYAQLPPGRNTSGKPWVVVSSDSSNEFVRALDSQVSVAKAASSLPAVADVVATASSITDKGASMEGHHYVLSVDPDKVTDETLGTLLRDLGENPVPIDLLLDKTGRPLVIRIAVKLGSQAFPVTVNVSNFNAPVHIEAPPSDQVAS